MNMLYRWINKIINCSRGYHHWEVLIASFGFECTNCYFKVSSIDRFLKGGE